MSYEATEAALIRAMHARQGNLLATMARTDATLFASMVTYDERTGERVQMAPMHFDMHDAVDNHRKVMIWAFVESGKSYNISVARVLWEIGNNPNITVMLISRTAALSKKLMGLVKSALMGVGGPGRMMRMVFPELAIDRTRPCTDTQVTVQRPNTIREPTILATSLESKNIQGSRVDLLVLDDILDHPSTLTDHQRNKGYEWVVGVPLNRLRENSRVWCLGNALHPEDAYHRLVKHNGFAGFRFPAVDRQGRPVWPEKRGYEWLAAKRDDLAVFNYQRFVLCEPISSENQRIQRQWVEACLKRGEGLQLLPTKEAFLAELDGPHAHRYGFPGGLNHREVRFYCGVDLAVEAKSSADETAFVVAAVLPNGVRRVLAVEAGRWTSPKTVERLLELWRRYGCSFWVERAGQQGMLIDLLGHASAIPITAYQQGGGRTHPDFGFERLATSLANEKWVLPCAAITLGNDLHGAGRGRHPELFELEGQLYRYDPASHTGDRAMAMMICNEAAHSAVGSAPTTAKQVMGAVGVGGWRGGGERGF